MNSYYLVHLVPMRRVPVIRREQKTIRVNPNKKQQSITQHNKQRYVSMLPTPCDSIVVKMVPVSIERKQIRRYSTHKFLPIPLGKDNIKTEFVPKTLTPEQVTEIKQLINEELLMRDLMTLYTNEILNDTVFIIAGLTSGAFLLMAVNEIRYRNTQKKLYDILNNSRLMKII